MQCGFQFKRNKIFNDKLSICGKCNCGGTINEIAENIEDGENVTIKCTVVKGSGECSKRYLRNPIRLEIGKHLYETNDTAMMDRIKEAEEIMSPEDPEPPHLYKQEALRKAAHEYSESQIFDKNPAISLSIAKRSVFTNIIYNIGLDPFYTIYWLKYQFDVYNHALKQLASVAIDATGSIVKKIVYQDKSQSQYIFLYTCVVNAMDGIKYPITQMLSESHNIIAIWLWLMQWIQHGAPPPREVTCDASIALLTAVVRAFTNCTNIDDYADKLWDNEVLPNCYIRIDVAHFIKIYAGFLKITRLRVKTFYLASISQLILARSIEEAENILFSIFTIASSETEGNNPDGTQTLCEIQKEKLKRILTSETSQDMEDLENNNLEVDEELHANEEKMANRWQHWANDVNARISSSLNYNDDRVNAHYLPQLVQKMKDIKWFPLWSAVCRDKFGYGRVPASSAAVEAEFGIVKTQLFNNVKLPIRSDIFIFKHIHFLKGRFNLICSATKSNTEFEAQSEIIHKTVEVENTNSDTEIMNDTNMNDTTT